MKTVSKEYQLMVKQNRLNTLLSNGKNVEGQGVCRKLMRQIRNLSN